MIGTDNADIITGDGFRDLAATAGAEAVGPAVDGGATQRIALGGLPGTMRSSATRAPTRCSASTATTQ